MLFGITQRACADSHKPSKPHAAASSQQPTDYYSSADGLAGKELKHALGQIVKDHTVFGYGELWYHYQVSDVVPGTENQVFDYYSPVVHYFTGGGNAVNGMNKEHACPQSWWGGGAICDAYSDLFNVMPSEVSANSAKSNFPLGVVSSPSYQNACMKVGPSARSEYSGNVFEPCDEYKGDFARLYFYVATCYADAPWGVKESVAKTVAFSSEDYPTIKSWLLGLLLQWNAQDPVSDWEILRNQRVCDEQGNRNPFVDYPQLADYIWGEKRQSAFLLAEATLHGSASGQGIGGFFPDDGNQGGQPGETTRPDDDPFGDDEAIGTILLDEDFSSVTLGNDTDNNGSSDAWSGNENFPVVTSAYMAGGAVRLGASKKAGQIQSRSLSIAAGSSVVVLLHVKGWTMVEGTLLVSLDGQAPQEVSYSHVMADGYETLRLRFENCQPQSRLTIATSAKRAFLSAVRVGVEAGHDQAIRQLEADDTCPLTYCNLMGQPVPAGHKGYSLSVMGRKAYHF